jgi:uncharacterized protein
MKILKWLAIIAASIYLSICGALYFFQERLIFPGTQLPKDFVYHFENPFTEININLSDNQKMNGLLFKADSSKGLIFYLHGNGGALNTWGEAAGTYLPLGYDFFVLDYRGYGKSDGEITSEQQVHDDIQTAYNKMLELYPENRIIVTGYSIGTGPATFLSAHNNPAMLILQAPYFNLTQLALAQYPFIPEFFLRYKFNTNLLLPQVKAPVIIFHGDADALITIDHAYQLQKLFKPSDKLVVLKGQGHPGINLSADYKQELKSALPN